jgi:hypothetical protein
MQMASLLSSWAAPSVAPPELDKLQGVLQLLACAVLLYAQHLDARPVAAAAAQLGARGAQAWGEVRAGQGEVRAGWGGVGWGGMGSMMGSQGVCFGVCRRLAAQLLVKQVGCLATKTSCGTTDAVRR